MFYVYVLYSFKDNNFYIGFTKDLKRRLNEHLTGNVDSTKNRRLMKLIYFEGYLNEQDARGREKFLKGGSGHIYLRKQLKHFLSKNA